MSTDRRPPVQYSMRRLLTGAALISVGLGSFSYAWLNDNYIDPPELEMFLWLAGGSVVGAGFMNLFRLWWVGAILGFVLAVLAGLALMMSPGPSGYSL